MKHLRNFAAGLLMMAAAVPATAQQACTKDYKPAPYNFIGVQGGGQLTFTNYQSSKLITPMAAVSLGRFFSPAVGARLNVSGWQTKGGFKGIDRTYDYKYITPSLDLMVNLSKIIMPSSCHTPFNVYLIGGLGLSYAWDNDDLNELRHSGLVKETMSWEDDRLTHNFRAGLQVEANLAKHFALNLEVNANNLHDRFNSKLNNHGDWQIQAMVGLTYKFGFKKQAVKAAPAPAPVVKKEEPKPAPAPVVKKEEPKPAPVVEKKEEAKPEKLRVDIFFAINSSEIRASEQAKVQRLGEWLKAHPKAKAELTGYADAKTGNADINRRLSEQRTMAVAKQLIRKYGISSSRISTGFKGDTVQPFSNNDDNRVVISIAEE